MKGRPAGLLLTLLVAVAAGTAAHAGDPPARDHAGAQALSTRLHHLQARARHASDHSQALARKVARLQHEARVRHRQLEARNRRIARLRRQIADAANGAHGGGLR